MALVEGMPYTAEFYSAHQPGARQSAQEVVPLVLQLFRPRSVIDVGCGTGSWLRVFQEHGVEEVLGVDGCWVDPAALEFPAAQFRAVDLRGPLRLDRTFDLALSLEVAEHLPQECAEIFVRSLTELADVVLFSAAVPCQGGTDHLNEQWPEYWATHFARRGYRVIDCLRGPIWQNERVQWWIAQNLLLFVNEGSRSGSTLIARHGAGSAAHPFSIVHPKRFLEVAQHPNLLERAAVELSRVIPPAARYILVDEDQLRRDLDPDGRAVPFLERDGEYWGPPSEDQTAIREFERLRERGYAFLVFAWPSFWWAEHYATFDRYLRERYRCCHRSELLQIFNLKEGEHR